ncbi:MAG: META domain-containing protein [Actinobacteria bacterium]|nr:META domain-containing protein [Actinomycetota bacterium]
MPRPPRALAAHGPLLPVAAALAMLVAACGTAPGPDAIDGVWRAVEIEVGGEEHAFGADGPGDVLTIEFGGGHLLRGTAPCNGFEGWYAFDGGTLDTADLVRGSAVCLDSRRETDALVFSLLETTRFEVAFAAGGSAMTWEGGDARAEFARP